MQEVLKAGAAMNAVGGLPVSSKKPTKKFPLQLAKECVSVGDIVFPCIWGDKSGKVGIEPVVVFWHSNLKCYYTTAYKPVFSRRGDLTLSPMISLMGWTHPTARRGYGLIVFLPDIKEVESLIAGPTPALLPENKAIEIDRVFGKSAVGHLVDIVVKGKKS